MSFSKSSHFSIAFVALYLSSNLVPARTEGLLSKKRTGLDCKYGFESLGKMCGHPLWMTLCVTVIDHCLTIILVYIASCR